MRRNRRRRGFTLIELLIVMAIIMVIAGIASVEMGKLLRDTHEKAAILQYRTFFQAELQYNSQFGTYATSLAQLGPPASGSPSAAAADLIPKSLADGHISGYIFSLSAAPNGYAISAVPEQFGNSGSRTFYADASQVVRNNYSQEPATANSPPVGASAAAAGGATPSAAPAATPAAK